MSVDDVKAEHRTPVICYVKGRWARSGAGRVPASVELTLAEARALGFANGQTLDAAAMARLMRLRVGDASRVADRVLNRAPTPKGRGREIDKLPSHHVRVK